MLAAFSNVFSSTSLISPGLALVITWLRGSFLDKFSYCIGDGMGVDDLCWQLCCFLEESELPDSDLPFKGRSPHNNSQRIGQRSVSMFVG